MINPPEIKEIEFTFRCRIATYERQKLADVHSFITSSMEQRLKDLVGQHGIVSSSESRMEGV
jgi:hypothetical protein